MQTAHTATKFGSKTEHDKERILLQKGQALEMSHYSRDHEGSRGGDGWTNVRAECHREMVQRWPHFFPDYKRWQEGIDEMAGDW